MSPPEYIEHDEKFAKFMYHDGDPTLSDTARTVLIEYSGIAEDDIVKYVRRVRDKAWACHKYPCIGNYCFADFSIGLTPWYPSVLQRLKSCPQSNLLDLGCCFGQDVRLLVYNGVPGEQLHGCDLEPQFIDLGYELFRDQDTLKATFKAGDFLGSSLDLKKESFDFIHTALFLHLFNWDESVEALSRALRLLKAQAGSMVFGRQVGVSKPGSKPEGIEENVSRSGEMYRHDVSSFARSIREAARKARVEVDIEIREGDCMMETARDGEVRFFTFAIVRR